MIYTLSIVTVVFVLLARDRAPADLLFPGALVLLLFGGIISPAEALAGFANRGMMTVAILFVVSDAVQQTGLVQTLADRFLKGGVGASGVGKRRMLRILAPAAALSPFLNNTPIVAIFTPIIKKWCGANDEAPSRYLIPLSYATILGGTLTLIGTSTTLVVHGLMQQAGFDGLRFFEIARVGGPMLVVGLLYILIFGPRLLPDRRDTLRGLESEPKRYLIEMRVGEACPLIGKSVREANLRNLQGVYLTDIERDGEHIGPISGTERIQAADRLVFAGLTTSVVDLGNIPGLFPVDQETFTRDAGRLHDHLVEVVVSNSSPAVGKTVKEYNFRSMYDAAVVAIHRNGEQIPSRLGDVELRSGDTLVLLTREDFTGRWRNSRDFYLVSKLDTVRVENKRLGLATLAVVVAMVAAASLGGLLPPIGPGGQHIDMFYAAAGAAFLLVAIGAVTPSSAKRSLQLDVLITIACAFGVSQALINSGAAAVIARALIASLAPFGPLGGLAAVYIATAVFTAVITNNAAAALMFPIAYATATELGAAPVPFFIAVAVAASASFATPIGYQTNLIVQGAGGYRFRDFVRIGLPLNILMLLVALFTIPIAWPL